MEKEKLPVKTDREQIIYYEDEIDLYELWLTLKKRWKVVISSTIIFLLFSVLYTFFSERIYEVSFTVKPPSLYIDGKKEPIVTKAEIKEYLNIVNNFIRTNKVNKLSEKLNIPVYMAKNLRKISVIDLKNSQALKVSVEYAFRNSNLEKNIVPAIITYLNDNPHVRNKLNQEKKRLSNLVSILNNRLTQIQKFNSMIQKNLSNIDK
ncbi:MAG: Wzz/FepE/Etk N-terminal domain-containing protein [Persephonella sp.]|nr:Wzz/FepE/Etk N-terminal domain-containing protein [Persephonella sp.]